jgi:hypothetical protein
MLEWVKQWLGYPSHYLPVVATRSLPCIYRRAAFPHRATPNSLPLAWRPRPGAARLEELRVRFAHGRCSKVEEPHQPKFLIEVSLFHAVVVK